LRLPLKNAVAKCHHANAIRDKCQWVRVMWRRNQCLAGLTWYNILQILRSRTVKATTRRESAPQHSANSSCTMDTPFVSHCQIGLFDASPSKHAPQYGGSTIRNDDIGNVPWISWSATSSGPGWQLEPLTHTTINCTSSSTRLLRKAF
jgi:hypothetical protein